MQLTKIIALDYRFACKQINMSIVWMSKDSIFMVNFEQYCVPNEKDCQKHVYIV